MPFPRPPTPPPPVHAAYPMTVMQVNRSSKTLGNIIQLVVRPRLNDMFMLDGTLDK